MKNYYKKLNKKLATKGEPPMSKREEILVKHLYKLIMSDVSMGGEKIWVWKR